MLLTKEELKSFRKLVSIDFIYSFDIIQKVDRYIYILEENLRSIFPDDAIDTKIPENFDPSATRFILQNKRKNRYLEVAMDKAVFKFKPTDNYSKNITYGIDYFKSKCDLIYNNISKVLKQKDTVSSCLLTIQYPLDGYSAEEMRSIYVKKFLKENIEKPYLINLTIAYNNNGYFINYTMQEFQTFKFKIDKKTLGANQNIYLKLMPGSPGVTISEQGLQIILDINNKEIIEKKLFDDNVKLSHDEIFKIAQEKVEHIENFIL